MAEDLGEKTEEPTEKRRQDARNDGQVARSADLSSAILLIAATVFFVAFGGPIARHTIEGMRFALSPDALATGLHTGEIGHAVGFTFDRLVGATLPMLVFIFLIAAVVQFAQVKWHPTLKPIKPKLSNIQPGKGIKRIFSKRTVLKSLTDILKVTLVGIVAVVVISANKRRIAALPLLTREHAMAEAARILLEVVAWALLAMLIIGIIDYFFQRWQHNEKLKMTKHEVKDERRSAEGDPQVKNQRFRFMQNLIMQRIQSSVPDADVVVTNPTHFAVALRYDPEKMAAPRVVAKGADHMAIRIRLVAASAGVPIVERPPLARALYWAVEPGDQVPVEHYEAVAELLAYVYRLEQRAAS